MHVDSVLLTLARHHAATDDEVHTVLDFVSCAAIEMRQFGILLANMGRRRAPLIDRMEASTYDASNTIFSNMTFPERWHEMDRRAPLAGPGMPPDTIVAALEGRRLGDLVEHPYLPGDVRIGTLAARDGRWSVGMQVDAPMPLRR